MRKSPERGFFLGNSLKTLMPQYFKDVRAEMKHVTWPTRNQALVYTLVVILVSLATAVYLGLLDFIFDAIVKHLVA